MKLVLSSLAAAAALALSATAFSQGMPRMASPDGARAYIVSPADGEAVGETFVVRFGLSGMGVAPAGVDVAETGHHHLLVDFEGLPAMDMPMPMSPQLLHFGKGQTETTLTLPKGEHTLQLVLGDKLHIPHEPPVISEKITIVVE